MGTDFVAIVYIGVSLKEYVKAIPRKVMVQASYGKQKLFDENGKPVLIEKDANDGVIFNNQEFETIFEFDDYLNTLGLYLVNDYNGYGKVMPKYLYVGKRVVDNFKDGLKFIPLSDIKKEFTSISDTLKLININDKPHLFLHHYISW